MTGPLTRQDIWTLSTQDPNDPWHPVIRAYAAAVTVLMARGNNDPTSWENQKNVHWDDDAPPTDQFLNQCQHGCWFFLPWHRMYLAEFEAIIRSVIASLPDIDPVTKATWALPYWNYSKDDQSRMLPPAFRMPQLDGRDNPLFDSRRDLNLNNGGSLAPATVDTSAALAQLEFESADLSTGFGGGNTQGPWHSPGELDGQLEQTPHDSVHSAVGGNGGDMAQLNLAPRDPIFWLHHANIDRLWQVWLNSGQGRSNTDDPAWLSTQTFWFHDANGQVVSKKVSDVLDIVGQLNYNYEDTSVSGPLGAEPVQPTPEHPPQKVGATDKSVRLTGDTADVSLPLTAPSGPLDAQTQPSRVYLRLDGMTSPDLPGVPYGVYLNIPADESGNPDEYYAGIVAPFGIEQQRRPDSDHGHGGGHRQVLDITDLYRRLNAQQRWSDRVSVRFVPIYTQPPPGPLDAQKRVPGVPPGAGTLDVGQISVYFQ